MSATRTSVGFVGLGHMGGNMTVSPQLSRELAGRAQTRGASMLDAPVSEASRKCRPAR